MVAADHTVRGKHGDAVADGIMAVVVLDEIVRVPDVNVIASAILPTEVLNVVGLIVLNDAGVAIQVHQSAGCAGSRIGD